VTKTLFIIISLAILHCSFAQQIRFRFAAGDRAATIYPFTHAFDNKLYPVIQTGFEYQYYEKNRFCLNQSLVFHYNYHPYLGYDFGIFSEASGSYKFKKPFYIQLNLGVGYLGELPADKTYKLNGNGEYIEVRPLHSMVSTSLSLMIGYEFENGFSIFSSYQYAIEFPYNRIVGILPTDNLLLGMKVKLVKNMKNEKP